MKPQNAELAALSRHLLDVDVPAEVLRRDPEGRGWLPAELAASVRTDASCRELVRDFATKELALYDDGKFRSDPFFTAAVMAKVPPPRRGLRPTVRLAIIGSFQGLGVVAAYWTLTVFASDEIHGWIDTVQDWFGSEWSAVSEPGVAWAAMVVLLGAVALIMGGDRPRSPVT